MYEMDAEFGDGGVGNYDEDDRLEFADPGGHSALRASSRSVPIRGTCPAQPAASRTG